MYFTSTQAWSEHDWQRNLKAAFKKIDGFVGKGDAYLEKLEQINSKTLSRPLIYPLLKERTNFYLKAMTEADETIKKLEKDLIEMWRLRITLSPPVFECIGNFYYTRALIIQRFWLVVEKFSSSIQCFFPEAFPLFFPQHKKIFEEDIVQACIWYTETPEYIKNIAITMDMHTNTKLIWKNFPATPENSALLKSYITPGLTPLLFEGVTNNEHQERKAEKATTTTFCNGSSCQFFTPINKPQKNTSNFSPVLPCAISPPPEESKNTSNMDADAIVAGFFL